MAYHVGRRQRLKTYPLAVEKNPRFSKYAFQLLWKNKTEIQYKHRSS